MGAYNFNSRYAPAILSGVKRSTIRPPRKNNWLPKPGEILALYQGMRTKHCKLIRRVVCESVEPVALDMEAQPDGTFTIGVALKCAPLSTEQLHHFALGEGFKDTGDMAEFFASKYGTQLSGWLIRWRPMSSHEESVVR